MASYFVPSSTFAPNASDIKLIQAGETLEPGRALRMGTDGLAYYASNSDLVRSNVIGFGVSKAYQAGHWVAYVSPRGVELTVTGATKGVQYYLDHGTDEVQTLTITGTPTGGTFNLSFGGQITAAIAYNAASSAVQSALEALSTIGVGNVAVSGSAGGPYTVTFKFALGAQNVALLVLATNGLTGGTSPTVGIVETTAGGATGAACLFADLVTGYAIVPLFVAKSTTSVLTNAAYTGVVL